MDRHAVCWLQRVSKRPIDTTSRSKPAFVQRLLEACETRDTSKRRGKVKASASGDEATSLITIANSCA